MLNKNKLQYNWPTGVLFKCIVCTSLHLYASVCNNIIQAHVASWHKDGAIASRVRQQVDFIAIVKLGKYHILELVDLFPLRHV